MIPLKQKANSIRIRHKTLRGVILVIRDRSRPIPNPTNANFPDCATCFVPHECKTYHLKLDDEGCILVSQGVYKGLCNLDDRAGFDISNVIHDPPTQTLILPIVDRPIQPFNLGEVHHASAS